MGRANDFKCFKCGKTLRCDCTTDVSESSLNGLLSVERSAVEALLYGSEGLQTLSHKMVALAHEKCPEHYKDFIELHKKHFNANCGPLHQHVKELLGR